MQHNYTPPSHIPMPEEKIKRNIALYGLPQMIHTHAFGEPCKNRCAVYLIEKKEK